MPHDVNVLIVFEKSIYLRENVHIHSKDVVVVGGGAAVYIEL
jgi:hypothetical protein